MSEWKPIETAPKDGRPILVAVGEAMFVARWYEDPTGFCWSIGGDALHHWAPTHWMPLPAPPQAETVTVPVTHD